jgi:hypothetical protein
MKLLLYSIDKKADIPGPIDINGRTYAVYRCADGHNYIDPETEELYVSKRPN